MQYGILSLFLFQFCFQFSGKMFLTKYLLSDPYLFSPVENIKYILSPSFDCDVLKHKHIFPA